MTDKLHEIIGVKIENAPALTSIKLPKLKKVEEKQPEPAKVKLPKLKKIK